MKKRVSVLRTSLHSWVSMCAMAMLLLIAAITPEVVFATPATPVTVGEAGTFAVLAGVTSTSSVTTGTNVTIFGNMGSGSPPNTAPNFLCGFLYTQTPPPIPPTLTAAYTDAILVRGQINTPPQPTPLTLTADLGGITLTPGVYDFSTTANMAAATTLTFDAQGDPNALFIIQVGTSLVINGNTNMVLTNGARSCNVYWRVGTSATIAGSSNFVGTLSAGTSISVAALTSVDGRLWADNDITLADNTTVKVPCALTVTKTPDVTSAQLGDVITYMVTITNNSPCGPMNITSVVDSKAGDVTANFATSVPASGSVSGQYTYTVQPGDTTPLKNLVTVSATFTAGVSPPITLPFTGTAAASVPLTPSTNPSISIVKAFAFTTGDGTHVGDVVTFTYTVTNTSNVTLDPVTVTDNQLGPITLGATNLAPGASTTGTATLTVTQDMLNTGSQSNTAITTGKPPTGPNVTATDIKTVTFTQLPAISIVKTYAWTTGDGTHVDDVVTYTYTVTNTGNVTLNPVSIIDDQLGPITPGAISLAPGASTTGTATLTVTQALLNAGSQTNIATASGQPPTGPFVTATDTNTVTFTQHAAIGVVKTYAWTKGDGSHVGDVVTFTYTVTNTGNVTLNPVTVTDNKLGTITLGVTSLAPGASTTGTKTYTLTQADITAGKVVNTATATGKPPVGPNVTATDSVTVKLPKQQQHLICFKFQDSNRNGCWDKGEPAIACLTIQLYDCKGKLLATQQTDSSGKADFPVDAGTYTVKEVMQDGWTNTRPVQCSVKVVCGKNPCPVYFGNAQRPKQHIICYKFNDGNRNGCWDKKERAIACWTIKLYDCKGKLLATQQTDSCGAVDFQVDAGTYTVKEVMQDGWTNTRPVQCSVKVVCGKDPCQIYFANYKK